MNIKTALWIEDIWFGDFFLKKVVFLLNVKLTTKCTIFITNWRLDTLTVWFGQFVVLKLNNKIQTTKNKIKQKWKYLWNKIEVDECERLNPYCDQALVWHPYYSPTKQEAIFNHFEIRGRGVCKENSSLRYRRLHTFTICTISDNFEKKTNLNDCIMI